MSKEARSVIVLILLVVAVVYLGAVCLLPAAQGQGPDQEVTPVDLHPKRGCRARWCGYLPGVWNGSSPLPLPTATSQMQ